MNKNDDQVILMLGQMQGDIKGILTYLENLNKRVVESREDITELEKGFAYERGKAKVTGSLWGIGSSIVTGIVLWVMTGKH